MREELKRREGTRGEFTAVFLRYGWRRGYRNVKTALFVDVRDKHGRAVTDHIWFKVGVQIDELNLAPYERVRFVATVGAYRHGHPDLDDGYRPVDYKLEHYSNMRREAAQARQGTLSLFEARAPHSRQGTLGIDG